MATIKRVEGKKGVTYEVQIRIRPYPPISKSFKKLSGEDGAKRWAERTENEMREGRYGLTAESRKKTAAEAIARYRKYVLPSVTKSRREHILDWWESTLGRHALKDITPALISEIRDKLLHGEMDGKTRNVATVVKYLATLSHILTMCATEWQWLEDNPVMKVSKPSLPKGRTRFLDDKGEPVFWMIMKEKSSYRNVKTVKILISTLSQS